ncbi:MAG: aminomethyl-transferring glycine dehydrogenase subunit GcvPB, partial [Candidatus Margulisiibacteriota bacterium]
MNEELIFEKSTPGQSAFSLPSLDLPEEDLSKLIPNELVREKLNLPELSELEVVRHFTRLSQKNFSIDTHFYPLGSCTMKYNPKVNEEVAKFPGFTNLHPLQNEDEIQGILELIYNFEQYLGALFGYDAFTFQPAAGAHGELTSLMMIKAYHRDRGQGTRNKVIIPDSSHGTNPASVTMVGY